MYFVFLMLLLLGSSWCLRKNLQFPSSNPNIDSRVSAGNFRNNFSRATEGVLVDAASNQWPEGESQVQQATLHAIDSSLAAYKRRLKPGTSETLIQ